MLRCGDAHGRRRTGEAALLYYAIRLNRDIITVTIGAYFSDRGGVGMRVEWKKCTRTERTGIGRRQAAAILFSDICIFGEGLAALLGLLEIYQAAHLILCLTGCVILYYVEFLMKPRIRTSKEWFQLAVEDPVTGILWGLSLVVLGIDIVYLLRFI